MARRLRRLGGNGQFAGHYSINHPSRQALLFSRQKQLLFDRASSTLSVEKIDNALLKRSLCPLCQAPSVCRREQKLHCTGQFDLKKRRKSRDRPLPSIDRVRLHSKASLAAMVLAVCIVVFAIVLRGFKAVHTGIIYDEVYTVMNFGQHFHDAMTLYKNPNNNHILNSILVNVDRILFGGHESFYRFHTIFFGAFYSVSMLYLVWALIADRLLRIAFVALLTLQWFVFDLSFLARGYSIALAAIFGALALLVWLQKRRITLSYIWIPVAILTAMNYLAFGSMLSVLLPLFVINGCYILLFSHRVFPEGTKPLKPVLIHCIAVPVVSAVSLYLLYQYIWRDILAARNSFGKMPLWQHVKEVLWVNMPAGTQPWTQVVYGLFLLLTVVALLYVVYLLLRTRNLNQISFLNLKQPQSFILLTTLLFIIGMIIYRNVFKMSLGFPRNSVFLIPLFLLSCGIILDGACGLLTVARLRVAVAEIICVVTLMLTVATWPSLYAVKVYTWEVQSIAGPLIRDLQEIDPQRRWKIALTPKTWHMNLPLQYYQINGYPVQRAGGNDFDVVVTHQSEDIPGAVFYRQEFYDSFECRVVFNPALIQRYALQENMKQ
jgi:hypothetical protein